MITREKFEKLRNLRNLKFLGSSILIPISLFRWLHPACFAVTREIGREGASRTGRRTRPIFASRNTSMASKLPQADTMQRKSRIFSGWFLFDDPPPVTIPLQDLSLFSFLSDISWPAHQTSNTASRSATLPLAVSSIRITVPGHSTVPYRANAPPSAS